MLKADRLNTSTACRPERQCDAFHMLLVICLDFLHLCMTFSDLAEGDKLAVVVVEL